MRIHVLFRVFQLSSLFPTLSFLLCSYYYLADDVLVGVTNNQTVLGGVVLVLVLSDEAEASSVISLALTSASVLNLESAIVRIGFDHLDIRHPVIDIKVSHIDI